MSNRHEYVFVAGAMSGFAEGITIQPLEMLKTRFQIHEGSGRLRMLPAIREILAEGGVRQLYRGGLPEIAGLMPRAAAALSTLEFSRRYCRAKNGGELPALESYACGALSGVSEGLAFAPFQVVKVRLMAKEHLGRYRNTYDCLRQLLAQEGPRALFIGLSPTLWRNCVWNSIYYGTVDQVEQRLPPLDSDAAEALRSLGVGVCVGVAATVFNAPFDVVKSRFQSQVPDGGGGGGGPGRQQQQQPANSSGSSSSGSSSTSSSSSGQGGGPPAGRKYTRVFPSLALIAREEGYAALYKGFAPKALRLGVGQSVGLVVFQRALRFFGADHGREDDRREARAAALIAD